MTKSMEAFEEETAYSLYPNQNKVEMLTLALASLNALYFNRSFTASVDPFLAAR